MPRRKTSKQNKKGEIKKMFALPFDRKSDTRFRISLIFLMAALLLSSFVLIFTMLGVQNNQIETNAAPLPSPGARVKANVSANPALKDSNLEFTLKIPTQLGQWLYKTGYVKSPADETLSDRYVTVFVPRSDNARSNNFDDMAQEIITVRRFSQDEWKKIDSGCGKGNQMYCEAMGTKIGEKNDVVWAYTKAKTCSKDMKAKCDLADKISQTFALE